MTGAWRPIASARQGRPAGRLPGASAGAGPRREAAATDAGKPGASDAGKKKVEAVEPTVCTSDGELAVPAPGSAPTLVLHAPM